MNIQSVLAISDVGVVTNNQNGIKFYLADFMHILNIKFRNDNDFYNTAL